MHLYRPQTQKRKPTHALCTVFAFVLVAGCASVPPMADSSSEAAGVMSAAQIDEMVSKAERSVANAPHDVAARSQLARTYLRAGRFESAATTFEDAMALGESDPLSALGQGLAHVAAGEHDEALAVFETWRDSIPTSDLGLALALAGETIRGVAMLADALHTGESTPTLRQNLAYAYALDGRWREARLMAAQDLSDDELDRRIGNWAMQGKPEDYRKRVASLLNVPLRDDTGQPPHLALEAASREAFRLASP